MNLQFVCVCDITGQKLKFYFPGATFHIPLTKSATLNRHLHCSLWQFSGALFWGFFEGSFLHFGGKIVRSPRVIFPTVCCVCVGGGGGGGVLIQISASGMGTYGWIGSQNQPSIITNIPTKIECVCVCAHITMHRLETVQSYHVISSHILRIFLYNLFNVLLIFSPFQRWDRCRPAVWQHGGERPSDLQHPWFEDWQRYGPRSLINTYLDWLTWWLNF